MGRHSRHSLYAANTLRLRARFASKAATPSRKDPRSSVHISQSVFMFRRKCRKTVARARSFPAARHDATNLTKVLRERAAPTGKVCRCWMASSRSAARCFAVSPCDSALPPHYWSRSVSGTGPDKSIPCRTGRHPADTSFQMLAGNTRTRIRVVSNSGNPGASSGLPIGVVAQSQAARAPGQIGNNVSQSVMPPAERARGRTRDCPGEQVLRSL